MSSFSRTLVIHVSHISCDNFKFFVKHALFVSGSVTFLLIRNDENASESEFDDILSKYPNVHIFIRSNTGHDFQGWNESLFLSRRAFENKIIRSADFSEPHIYSAYSKFIFVNSTVAGPYLPRYVKDNWVDCFLSPLDDEVKLVGISINHVTTYMITNYTKIISDAYGIVTTTMSHVQSMIFGTDIIGLSVLLEKRLFSLGKIFPANKTTLIILHEIAMSIIIMNAGYKLFSMIRMDGHGKISAADAEEIKNTKHGQIAYDDIWLPRRYHFSLEESMFIKTNRGFGFPEKSRHDLTM